MWWIIDAIAAGDFEALGALVAVGTLLTWLAIRQAAAASIF
jgi:hypothetical protein